MATTFIKLGTGVRANRLRQWVGNLQNAAEGLENEIAVRATMIDGDGSSATHFTLMTAECGYESNADAKRSWEELNSLNFKLTGSGANTAETAAALAQCAALHGI